MFVLAVAAALFALVPSSAVATEPNNESATYKLVMFATDGNKGVAPNGDIVRVFGGGTFSVHPKSVSASGTFLHETSGGTVLGGGSWTATDLLSFQPYGCGVVASVGATLPPNFCGGQVKMRVMLTTPIGTFDGILTVFCIVGPNPPNSHDEPPEEGVTLDIPGVINFNHTAGGGNLYIKTSPAVS